MQNLRPFKAKCAGRGFVPVTETSCWPRRGRRRGKASQDAELRRRSSSRHRAADALQMKALADFDAYVAADVERRAPRAVGLDAKQQVLGRQG
jgi:hypothetical protein